MPTTAKKKSWGKIRGYHVSILQLNHAICPKSSMALDDFLYKARMTHRDRVTVFHELKFLATYDRRDKKDRIRPCVKDGHICFYAPHNEDTNWLSR